MLQIYVKARLSVLRYAKMECLERKDEVLERPHSA